MYEMNKGFISKNFLRALEFKIRSTLNISFIGTIATKSKLGIHLLLSVPI